MRSVQEVFDVLIKEKLYSGEHLFMCFSLKEGLIKNIITEEEYRKCKLEINEYIYPYKTLHRRLKGIIGSVNCLEIYKDWENRPFK